MSYNTLAEAQLFDAGLTQAHLDETTIYLNSRFDWPGILSDTTQSEDWPRMLSDGSVVLDANGRELTGIPEPVKQAELVGAQLVMGGNSLLPSTVADATSASTQGRDLIEDTVQSGDGDRVTQRWSASSTETSTRTVQTLTDSGLPIIAKIDAILKPITDAVTGVSGNNYYLLRA